MRFSYRVSTSLFAAGLLFSASSALAQTSPHAAAVQAILASPAFKAAAADLDKQHGRIVDEGIMLTEIPAPPFMEEKRAKKFAEMFKEAGLADVQLDQEGNVLGFRKGTKGDGKFVVISAHLDTVFPPETDVKVKRVGNKLNAPGVGDDTFSLAAMLGMIRAMNVAGIKTRDDIMFVGTVGEEGQGDLRGVRYMFTKGPYKDKIKTFFSIEAGSVASITNGAVGSKRYRFTFKGPGGHSYGAFGLVNPMYALGQAAANMSQMEVPEKPKTTYSIGVIGGGTSVNSIPLEGWMEVDMRSEAPAELKKIEDKILAAVQEAVKAENGRHSTKEGALTVDVKLIGDRPAGGTAEKSELVQMATAAIAAGGYKADYGYSSTDSNIPMSLGIPAITIGKNAPDNRGGRAHSLDEWIDIEKGPMVKGMTTSLSILMAVTGMETK
ncbi:MAG: M20/M25/M40 family metallo-hydrolase [Rhodospirillaceae bacterium]